MAVQLTDPQKSAVSTFIAGLKTDTVWDEIEAFAFFAFPTQQQGLLDWKRTSTSWTAGGSGLIHTGLSGIQGSGSGGGSGYIGSGVNHSTATQALRNDQHWFCGIKALSAAAASSFVHGVAGSSASNAFHNSVTNFNWRCGQSAGETGSGLLTVGRWLATRQASNLATLYKNGVSNDTNVVASTASTAEEIVVHRAATSYGTNTVAFFGFGGGLDGTQSAAFDARMATFLTAMGVTL